MQPLRREYVMLLLILDLSSRWGWVVCVTPRPRFTTGKGPPGTHGIGSWVGLGAGLDLEAEGQILCLCRGSNPLSSSLQSDWTELPRLCLHLIPSFTARETERRSRVVSTPASYSGDTGFKFRPGDRLFWLRFFVFFQSVQANTGIRGLP
jgi:hypothetical protein